MDQPARQSFFTIFSIAILGTIILTCTNGMTFSGITVFDDALLEAFGWSKSELKFRDLINLVAASVLMPFVGAFIDRYGVRRSMVGGLLLIALMYYCYAFIQSATQMYAIHLVFAIAVSGAGTLAVMIMVSQQVHERRGLAIGIALAGTSAGGIIMPQIGTPLLEAYGWRQAFQLEAIIPLVLMVVVFFVLRSRQRAAAQKPKPVEAHFNLGEALRTPVFWAICLTGVCCFYAIMGIIGNLFLYLLNLGFTEREAGNTFSIFFAIILAAKFLSGYTTEFINEYRLFKIQLVLLLVGTVGMAFNTSELVWPSLIAVGLGWGGLYTLLNYIIISTFGVKNVGKIGGIISTFEGIGSGIGIWLTALISDRTGSYSASFWVVVGLLSVALVISFFIRPVGREVT